MKKILTTGALSPLGEFLAAKLEEHYGSENVFCTDFEKPTSVQEKRKNFYLLDITSKKAVSEFIHKFKIQKVVHFSEISSLGSEKNPMLSWDVNVQGLINILELSRESRFELFIPSFSFNQEAKVAPKSFYGLCQSSIEKLISYYTSRYGIIVKRLCLPAIVFPLKENSLLKNPSEYASNMIFSAFEDHSFSCPIEKNSFLKMSYIDDIWEPFLEVLEDNNPSPASEPKDLCSFVASPASIQKALEKINPNFEVSYILDAPKQKILSEFICQEDEPNKAFFQGKLSLEKSLERLSKIYQK